MKYLMMKTADQAALFDELERMPGFLRSVFEDLDPTRVAQPGPDRLFSPVEQCWHLADLEREGFGVRIRRMLDESDPALPDFDGDRVARERNYRSLSLRDAIAAFHEARRSNLAALRVLTADQWSRQGVQEGVGAVGLCDMPSLMAQHDAAHRAEIEIWMESVGRS